MGTPKGVSGNPAGVSAEKYRKAGAFSQWCREQAEIAGAELMRIIKDPEAETASKVNACRYIIDRAYGKARETKDLNVNNNYNMLLEWIARGAPDESRPIEQSVGFNGVLQRASENQAKNWPIHAVQIEQSPAIHSSTIGSAETEYGEG